MSDLRSGQTKPGAARAAAGIAPTISPLREIAPGVFVQTAPPQVDDALRMDHLHELQGPSPAPSVGLGHPAAPQAGCSVDRVSDAPDQSDDPRYREIHPYGDPALLPIDKALADVFAHYQLPVPGGESKGLGWSGFSMYQRCPYLWKRIYLDDLDDTAGPAGGKPPALAVGILIHVLLAVLYKRQLADPGAWLALDPRTVCDDLLSVNCDASVVNEAWRVFAMYQLAYEQDYIIPLAVEEHGLDPVTGRSCRWDLIARVEESPKLVPGTYICEHKSASRFDDATLTGWKGDGEVIGQIDVWKRLKLDKTYGKLRGVIINLLGKQQTPKFERVIVPPYRNLLKVHGADLEIWAAQRKLAVATGVFPRARGNCIGRYGKCFQFEHCTQEGPDR